MTLSRKPRIPSLRGATTLAACWLLAGCAGQTLFQSDVARHEAYTPPIGSEKVGTTAVDPVGDQPAPAQNDRKNVVDCAKELGLQVDPGNPYKLRRPRVTQMVFPQRSSRSGIQRLRHTESEFGIVCCFAAALATS
jgi:hypothetical protein